MLSVIVSPDPTRFYQDEVGVELKVTISLDGVLLDLTYAEVTLIVEDNPNSPFTLDPTGNEGEAKYITLPGDFNTNGDPTRQYGAHVKFVSDIYDETFLSDEFPIYVVQQPTLNL